MNFNITHEELHSFRLKYYPERLSKATSDKEKRFLRKEVQTIKTAKNVTENFQSLRRVLRDGDNRLFHLINLPVLPKGNNYSGPGGEMGFPKEKMGHTGKSTQNEQTKI
jgi:hypothetical protein